jgi:glycosidase
MTLPGAAGLYYGDEVGMTGGEEPGSRGAFPWHDETQWLHGQLDAVRGLTALRRQHAALREGRLDIVAATTDGVAFTRTLGDRRVGVVVNRGPEEFPAPFAGPPGAVLWGRATLDHGGAIVPGPGAAIFAL